MEAVNTRWDAILEKDGVRAKSGSKVVVRFILNSDGLVKMLTKVDADSSSAKAEESCIKAILELAPYEKWTDAMIASLGREQELTFAFVCK